MKNNESGFVLITAIVLLAILTLAGVTSVFKSLTEIKMSKMSADIDKSLMAANVGLTHIYWYWSKEGSTSQGGIKEYNDMRDFLEGVTTSYPPIYNGDLAPVSMDDIRLVDAAIQADSNIRVFTITDAGPVPGTAWKGAAAGTNPQVAVWMTTFDDVEDPDYPYATPIDKSVVTTTRCPNGCRVVTYALGRSGESRVLLRESQSFLDQKLGGVSAMTNAPGGDNFSQICSGSSAGTGIFSDGTLWPLSSVQSNGRFLIEATQAMFQESVPSGTAMAANTQFRKNGSFLFRKGNTSKTGAVFKNAPLLMYSGHGRGTDDEAVKVDYASIARATTTNNLPSGELPIKLVDAPLMTDRKIEYFSKANSNLFNIDSYRWAAEQLTCQDPNANDGVGGNGNYCSKGELLRQAMVDMGYNAFAPVTGRLTQVQFEYNVSHAIPMFGFVRLMLPAIVAKDGNNGNTSNFYGGPYEYSETCKTGGTPPTDVFEGHIMGGDHKKTTQDPAYSFGINDPGNPATGPYGKGTYTNDGKLGKGARMIVYGTVVIDYFHDEDNDGFFDSDYDAAKKEWILTPLESPDAYFQPDFPILINPVMPRFTGANDPYAFPTAAPQVGTKLDQAGRINMSVAVGASPASVSLASPYDGYFPWAEGMMMSPLNTTDEAGTMRLMDSGGAGLVAMAKALSPNTKTVTVSTKAENLMKLDNPESVTDTGKEYDILHYYYDLMKPTIDPYNAMDYPVAPWPGDLLGSDFCMGKYDCGTSTPDPATADVLNHMGDKMHLMFPTGYMHGWKVALAALNIKADEFNHILSGAGGSNGIVAGLYAQIKNCTVATCQAGRPFAIKDAGFKTQAAVQAVEDSEEKYFYVAPDPGGTGYGVLDYEWQDIPSTIYSGGLIDIHGHTNMSGIMYTPGPLEWGTEGLSYINGSIITGYGMSVGYRKDNKANLLLVYDMQSVDNATTSLLAIKLRRYDWQRLY